MSSKVEGKKSMKRSKPGRKVRSWLKHVQVALYVIVLGVLVGFLFAQTYQCLRKYFSFPTYVETHIVDQQLASFMAITICAEIGIKQNILKVRNVPP